MGRLRWNNDCSILIELLLQMLQVWKIPLGCLIQTVHKMLTVLSLFCQRILHLHGVHMRLSPFLWNTPLGQHTQSLSITYHFLPRQSIGTLIINNIQACVSHSRIAIAAIAFKTFSCWAHPMNHLFLATNWINNTMLLLQQNF